MDSGAPNNKVIYEEDMHLWEGWVGKSQGEVKGGSGEKDKKKSKYFLYMYEILKE